jgi:hypothetical protein
LKQATEHGAAGNPTDMAFGKPAHHHTTKVVETAGDAIKVLNAREGISRPGNAVLDTGSVTDTAVNPRQLNVTNRTTDIVPVRPGGADACMQAPMYVVPGAIEARKQTAEATYEPDLDLVTALDSNPYLPVQLRPSSRAPTPAPRMY